jgi:hypothetical protein
MYCFDVLATFSFSLTGSYGVDLFGYNKSKTTQDHQNEMYCGVGRAWDVSLLEKSNKS